MTRRTAVTVLAAVLAAGTACAAPTGQRLPAAGPPPVPASPAQRPVLDVTATAGAAAPRPPADGAWIGAWAKPDLPTADRRVAALAEFEQQLGRPVDVAHAYHEWDDELPSQDDRELAAGGRTLLLSWAGADTRQIQSGQHDDLLREKARAVKEWGAPVLLEWRGQMDRPNLQAELWSPADYVAAWRHIRAVFEREQVDNVAWVWCPRATGFVDGRAPAYYPGDDQVDWLCADTYPGKTPRSFQEMAGPFLGWAAAHPRPVIIGEFGVDDRGGQREQWLAETAAHVVTAPQIKGLVYVDADRSGAGDRPYDTSLRSAPRSMAAFSRIALDPYFDVRRATGATVAR